MSIFIKQRVVEYYFTLHVDAKTHVANRARNAMYFQFLRQFTICVNRLNLVCPFVCLRNLRQEVGDHMMVINIDISIE